MKMDYQISKFISESPLYKKMETLTDLYGPTHLQGYTLDFFCEEEKKMRTFELEIYSNDMFAKSISEIPVSIYNDVNAKKVNYTQHFKAHCTSCKKYSSDIILNVSTE